MAYKKYIAWKKSPITGSWVAWKYSDNKSEAIQMAEGMRGEKIQGWDPKTSRYGRSKTVKDVAVSTNPAVGKPLKVVYTNAGKKAKEIR